MFIDDIELLLQLDNPKLTLYPDSNSKKIDLALEDILKKTLKIQIDQDWKNYSFLGKEYKNDILQCYMEIEGTISPKIIAVQNTILFSLFEDQQNIIHFKNGNKRKSFLLHSDNKMIRFSLN